MVVFDHGQPNGEQREGVTFYTHTGYFLSLNIAPPESVSGSRNKEETTVLSTQNPSLPLWKRAGYKLYFLLRSPTAPGSIWVKKYILFYKFYNLFYRILRLGPKLVWRVLITIYTFSWRVKWRILTWKQKIQLWLNSYGRIGRYIIAKDKVAVYKQADADIYLFAGQGNIAAELAHYCKKQKKRYIFLAGSDLNYNSAYKDYPYKTDTYGVPGYLAAYAIENATWHIVQNSQQAELLEQHYKRSSTIIRNPIDLNQTFSKQIETDIILWVGKSDKVKRPEIILDLARQCSEYHYVIIMTYSHPDIYERSLKQAGQLANVTILHYVSFGEIEKYFAQAKLFVNTSVFEGFPNTFLQAAKYGVPIVSYQVDPGEMISHYQCGLLCNGDFAQLENNVRFLMTTSDLYKRISHNCQDYLRQFHDKNKILDEYESVLFSVLYGKNSN